jgi:NAD-dependent DNA ligase
MDVDGLGEKLCLALHAAGLVKDVADIYSLTEPQLQKMKEKVKEIIATVQDLVWASHQLTKEQKEQNVVLKGLSSQRISGLGRGDARIAQVSLESDANEQL